MALSSLLRFLRVELRPPAYLTLPTAGIDISASGIKIAILTEGLHGLELSTYGESHLPSGAFVNGDIVDRAAVVKEIQLLVKKHTIGHANIGLPEAKGYLFETDVAGEGYTQWRTALEQHIDEFVPLPPKEITFDIVPTGVGAKGTHMIGIGYARRMVEETFHVCEEAGIIVRALEPEMFAIPRALLPAGSQETVLIVDIGKSTSKLMVVEAGLPRFAATLAIGGHALTLAVQKHFGVSEAEARRIKLTQGFVAGEKGDEYIAALLPTVSAIREEVARHLEYWQTRAANSSGQDKPVSRVIVVGGNASFMGLTEYLEAGLKMPVTLADVFINCAPKNKWIPPLDYMESLAYATAIGLALRDVH